MIRMPTHRGRTGRALPWAENRSAGDEAFLDFHATECHSVPSSEPRKSQNEPKSAKICSCHKVKRATTFRRRWAIVRDLTSWKQTQRVFGVQPT